MAFQRWITQGFTKGSNLILPQDMIPEGGVRLLQNARLTRKLGVISNRAGMQALATDLGTIVRSLWTLFGVSANTRYAHVDSTLSRLSSVWTTPTTLSSSAGSTPTSMANAIDGEGGLWTYFTNTTLGQRKDDGTSFFLWGIAPPTAAPSAVGPAADLTTTIDLMNAAANFTVTAGLTAGPTDETNVKIEGTGSVTVAIAASTVGSLAKSMGGTTNLDTLTGGDSTVKDDDYIHLWVRADRPDRVSYLQMDFDLDTTAVADAFRTNYYSVRLPGTVWLNQGANQWTRVQVPKSSFQRFGTDTSLTWLSVKSVRLSVLTTADGACQLYFDDWKLRGGTDIVGSVKYTACYKRSATGARGNPPKDADSQVVFTSSIDVDRQRTSLNISNILQGGGAHPGDTQMDQILLYRSIDAGTAQLIDTIADTASSPYIDDVSVASLLLSRTLEDDNDVPPNGHVVFGPGALNRLFLLVGQNDLYFSKAWEVDENRVENWPSGFRTTVGDGSEQALTGLVSDTTVLIWTDQRTYTLQGYGADTFLPVAVPNSRGTVSRFALAEGDGRLFFVSQDGVYQQIGMTQQRLTDTITPFFAGQTTLTIAGWDTSVSALAEVRLSWHADPFGPFLLMLYPRSGSSTADRELYIGKNPATGEYTDISFDVRGGSITLRSLYRDPEANTFIGGSGGGGIYQLEVPTLESDAGSAMSFRAMTRAEHQGAPHRSKHYAQVLVEANTSGETMTVTAFYDKEAITESLGTFTSTTDTGSATFTVSDPTARRQDFSLNITGTVDARMSLFRYGWYYEIQPEALTFWDSGLIPFGVETLVKELWYTLDAPATVTFTVYVIGQGSFTTDLLATTGRETDRLFFGPGRRGRLLRVTLSSSSAFRLWALSAKVKPYGTAIGYTDVPLLQAA